MQQFHDFESNDSNKTCLLKKTIYDFKQSIKMWYETLKNFFINIDYVKFFFDHFVFIHENDMIITVYVNDLLLIESKLSDVFDFKNKLMIRFRVKNLKKIAFYLKIKIIQNRQNRKMKLNQTIFIKRFMKNCEFHELKIRSISIFMKCIDFITKLNDQTYTATFDEIHAYQMILRSLQWLIIITKQNIIYFINKFVQFSVNLTSIYMQTMKRMIRYLTETNKLCIRYDSSNEDKKNLINYINSAYDNDVIIKRFHFDYVFKLWNDSIFHLSKRQCIVATFFIEIEYVIKCNAAKKTFFISQIMIKLKYEIDDFVDLRTDNQNAIKLVNNFLNHARIKHIPIQFHYVQKLMKNDYVQITYVNIENMIADDLTKALSFEKFKNFVTMLKLIIPMIEKI